MVSYYYTYVPNVPEQSCPKDDLRKSCVIVNWTTDIIGSDSRFIYE